MCFECRSERDAVRVRRATRALGAVDPRRLWRGDPAAVERARARARIAVVRADEWAHTAQAAASRRRAACRASREAAVELRLGRAELFAAPAARALVHGAAEPPPERAWREELPAHWEQALEHFERAESALLRVFGG